MKLTTKEKLNFIKNAIIKTIKTPVNAYKEQVALKKFYVCDVEKDYLNINTGFESPDNEHTITIEPSSDGKVNTSEIKTYTFHEAFVPPFKTYNSFDTIIAADGLELLDVEHISYSTSRDKKGEYHHDVSMTRYLLSNNDIPRDLTGQTILIIFSNEYGDMAYYAFPDLVLDYIIGGSHVNKISALDEDYLYKTTTSIMNVKPDKRAFDISMKHLHGILDLSGLDNIFIKNLREQPDTPMLRCHIDYIVKQYLGGWENVKIEGEEE